MIPELSEQERNWYILKGYEIAEFDDYRGWFLNGKLHREDGPAVERPDAARFWFLNGKQHREDGLPAIEYADGTRQWWVNGELHRENGPAYESADGSRSWWLNGEEVTEEEFNSRTKEIQNVTT